MQFERQIRRVQRDVLRMGALVENSCWLARGALCERDLDAAQQIALQDKQIDQLYRQIEIDCVNLMALQAPVTQDLRLLSALMQLIRDLERIGDYAEDIGEISVKLFPYPVPSCIDRVQVMSRSSMPHAAAGRISSSPPATAMPRTGSPARRAGRVRAPCWSARRRAARRISPGCSSPPTPLRASSQRPTRFLMAR